MKTEGMKIDKVRIRVTALEEEVEIIISANQSINQSIVR